MEKEREGEAERVGGKGMKRKKEERMQGKERKGEKELGVRDIEIE